MSGRDLERLMQVVRRRGLRDVSGRLLLRAGERLVSTDRDFPLRPGDIAAPVDSPATVPWSDGRAADRALVIGWVMAPPVAGSGGHTTAFRMIRALEDAGHRCVVLLYDRHGVDLTHYGNQVRIGWPWIQADVFNVDDDLPDLDVCVATGWPSAHVVAARGLGRARFYFIQDYEPFFHPRGFEYDLAEQSYRLGLVNIALGEMVHRRLRDELGVASAVVPFSCDSDTYSLRQADGRRGVVCYARPGTARRGFLLDVLALERFHADHPLEPIHVYGDPTVQLPFPHVNHGKLSPGALAQLYNEVVAGLAMSFTNISLVAEEMLACGVIPVVNDSADARADIESPYVRWCRPSPQAVADELAAAAASHSADLARAAAGSIRRDNWSRTSAEVRVVIETLTAGGPAIEVPSVR